MKAFAAPLAALALAACGGLAHAGTVSGVAGTLDVSPVLPLTSNNGSTTIVSGGAFQTLLAANPARKGCLIENPTTASEVLYVSVGIATGSATTAKSFSLLAGSSFSCNTPFGVITDNIAVDAATSTHAFVETDQ